LKQLRIGLWDSYGGSITSGWTRWLLEQFEFPFEVVYPKTLDAGDLASHFDVLIFPDGAIPIRESPAAASPIPRRFRRVSATGWARYRIRQTVPELKKFVEAGGTLLAIGSSTAIGYHFGLPMRNALIERASNGGGEVPLPTEKFFVPGAIVDMRIDTSSPLAYGLNRARTCFSTTVRPSACCRTPRRRASRRSGGSTVRVRFAADGPGGNSIWIRRRQSSMRRSGEDTCSCSDRKSPGERNRTARSNCCSTAFTPALQIDRPGRL
jgi:hypothetical protein